MILKCLLVDDEPPALDILESYVATVGNLEVVATCENAIDAFQILQHTPVDLLFLDIKMPTLLGTDLLRSLRTRPKVIFTTAYREYALEGFDLDAVDYLLKPISLERFLRAISKVMKTEAADRPPEKRFEPNPDEFLYFRAERKMVRMLTADILYVESVKDYVRIYSASAPPLVVKRTITSVETLLPESRFLRIHRSFLVALAKITAYTAAHVYVSGQELPIGRLYNRHVLQTLASLTLGRLPANG